MSRDDAGAIGDSRMRVHSDYRHLAIAHSKSLRRAGGVAGPVTASDRRQGATALRHCDQDCDEQVTNTLALQMERERDCRARTQLL